MKIKRQWSWIIWLRIQLASLLGRGSFLNIIEIVEVDIPDENK